MGKAVQMFCSGDWDHKRVPQGTENLDSLLDASPSHLPMRPQRCFTGESSDLTIRVHAICVWAVSSVTSALINSATFGRVCAPDPGVLLICRDNMLGDNHCR